jgi:hypothetical protein
VHPPRQQVSAEDFEREAREAAAPAPDADTEVLQKLLTVKDQMIWWALANCLRAHLRVLCLTCAVARASQVAG